MQKSIRRALGWVLSASVALQLSALSSETSAPRPASDVARSTPIGWKDLDSEGYGAYLERLRAAGCPEDKIRMIVRADADEWLLQNRVAHAVANDFAWWKAEAPRTGIGDAFKDVYQQLRTRRGQLIARWIGETENEPTPPPDETIAVHLSGPVLGALSPEKYKAVQDVCARALDRHHGYYNSRQNQGVFLNQGDMAHLRDKTREDLSQILTPDELEEFLLRYSHNANSLRNELNGLEPTPDEFRAIFRSVDELEHRLQLEYGALDSLSARQREEFSRQREEAIKSALTPERYQRYLLVRYPLFRQAQLEVRKAGLPNDIVLPFYEVLNGHESRRRELLNNTALNGVQRQAGLQSLEQEKEQALRTLLGEEGYRQYRDSRLN